MLSDADAFNPTPVLQGVAHKCSQDSESTSPEKEGSEKTHKNSGAELLGTSGVKLGSSVNDFTCSHASTLNGHSSGTTDTSNRDSTPTLLDGSTSLLTSSPSHRTNAQFIDVRQAILSALGSLQECAERDELLAELRVIDSHVDHGDWPRDSFDKCMNLLANIGNKRGHVTQGSENLCTPSPKKNSNLRRPRCSSSTKSAELNVIQDDSEEDLQVVCHTGNRCPQSLLQSRVRPIRSQISKQLAGSTISVDADDSDRSTPQVLNIRRASSRFRVRDRIRARREASRQQRAQEKHSGWRERVRKRTKRFNPQNSESHGAQNPRMKSHQHVEQGNATDEDSQAGVDHTPIDPSLWAPPSPPKSDLQIDPSLWAPPSPPKSDMRLDTSSLAPPSPPPKPMESPSIGMTAKPHPLWNERFDLKDSRPRKGTASELVADSPQQRVEPSSDSDSDMLLSDLVPAPAQQRPPASKEPAAAPLHNHTKELEKDLPADYKIDCQKLALGRDASEYVVRKRTYTKKKFAGAAQGQNGEINTAAHQLRRLPADVSAEAKHASSGIAEELWGFQDGSLRNLKRRASPLRFYDADPSCSEEEIQSPSSDEEAPLGNLLATKTPQAAQSYMFPWSGGLAVAFLQSPVSEDEGEGGCPADQVQPPAESNVAVAQATFDWKVWSEDAAVETEKHQHSKDRAECELVWSRTAFEHSTRQWLSLVEVPSELTDWSRNS